MPIEGELKKVGDLVSQLLLRGAKDEVSDEDGKTNSTTSNEQKTFLLPHVDSRVTITIAGDVFRNPSQSTVFLGRGSFGDVYGYRDKTLNYAVAIKKINIPKIGGREEVENIRKEVGINENLKHKNITQYVGNCEIDNNLFIILEHMENGSLRSKLNEIRQSRGTIREQSALSNDLIRKYTFEIISGLVYLHLNSVIHRDLRAANVLLSANDTAKIADFGIAKELDCLATQSGFSTVVGNAYWRSPELIQNETKKCGRRVDTWSLGITILEMIHVIPPFMEQYEHAAYMFALCVRKEVPNIPDFVSDDIKLILRRCLVFDAEKRSHSKDLISWD